MAKIYYKNLHMSDFCSKFAAEFDMIMEKRTYIQPKMEMSVMPKDALLDFIPSPNINPAPARVNVAPATQPGPEGVWM